MFNEIIKIYKQSIKNLPLLKYSWVLIATICILSLIAYFKLQNSDVFLYTLVVLFICFFGFLISSLLNSKDQFTKILINILLTSIVSTIAIGILSFGAFILYGKPDFYSRWFPDNRSNPIAIDATNNNRNADDEALNLLSQIDKREKNFEIDEAINLAQQGIRLAPNISKKILAEFYYQLALCIRYKALYINHESASSTIGLDELILAANQGNTNAIEFLVTLYKGEGMAVHFTTSDRQGIHFCCVPESKNDALYWTNKGIALGDSNLVTVKEDLERLE